MNVEQFLRWWRRALRQRHTVLASLLRQCTELCARPKKRASLAEEEEGDVGEDECVKGGGEQGDEKRPQGVFAFESIFTDDVLRGDLLEFL